MNTEETPKELVDRQASSEGQLILRLTLVLLVVVIIVALVVQRGGTNKVKAKYQPSPQVQKEGQVEVTARLVKIPGEFLPNDNFYNYAFVMKYEVVAVHRGQVKVGSYIYVAHYNPLKLRSAAMDDTLDTAVGGTLKKFQESATHRLALVGPIDEYYIGGIINRFAKTDKPKFIYWACWTELTP